MEVWPRRLEAFRTARSSAMASSSSSERPPSCWPGRRWLRCCFRAAWPLRGAECAADEEGLAWLGRRATSKLGADGDGPEGDDAGVDTERDLPRMEFVELMVAGRGATRSWAKGVAGGWARQQSIR